jgi:hypothetical protein
VNPTLGILAQSLCLLSAGCASAKTAASQARIFRLSPPSHAWLLPLSSLAGCGEPQVHCTMAAELPNHPFLLSIEETAAALETNVDDGLPTSAVADRQNKYPPNELNVGGGVAWYTILSKQLINAMILVSSRHSRCAAGRAPNANSAHRS